MSQVMVTAGGEMESQVGFCKNVSPTSLSLRMVHAEEENIKTVIYLCKARFVSKQIISFHQSAACLVNNGFDVKIKKKVCMQFKRIWLHGVLMCALGCVSKVVECNLIVFGTMVVGLYVLGV